MSGPAPQARGVGQIAHGDDVDQSAGQSRWPLGEEAAYLVLDRDGRVHAPELVGDVVQVAAELVGERLRVVEIAGGQVLVRAPSRPAH